MSREEINNMDLICPVCGYFCLGHGGVGCIDKPFMVQSKQQDITVEITELINRRFWELV